MDSPPSPNLALADAARAVAARRLGKNRLPVKVVVSLDDALELEGVTVEIVGLIAPEGRITDCLRDVIVLLARENKRLTTTKIVEGLERQGTGYGETTIKTTLAQAIRDDVLTSRPDAKPGGYGLPSWVG